MIKVTIAEKEALERAMSEKAIQESLDNLLYWVERAVSKGNANSDIEEAYTLYEKACQRML